MFSSIIIRLGREGGAAKKKLVTRPRASAKPPPYFSTQIRDQNIRVLVVGLHSNSEYKKEGGSGCGVTRSTRCPNHTRARREAKGARESDAVREGGSGGGWVGGVGGCII